MIVNPTYWPNPTSFLPDRWHPNANSLPDKKAFLPFSIGTRNCPGQNVAIKELLLSIVSLLREFEFEKVTINGKEQNPEIGLQGVPYLVKGYSVGIQKRK